MKHIFIFLTLFLCQNSFSQTQYEPGYVVLNSGEKKQVVIKQQNWGNNISQIEVRENNTTKEFSIEDISEFGIDGKNLVFIRHTVSMDRSSREKGVSVKEERGFNEETVFLLKLVEGVYSLYEYSDGSLVTFFYKDENELNQLLIYKSELGSSQIHVNRAYQNQIVNLYNSSAAPKGINRLNYSRAPMTQQFIDLNEFYNSSINVMDVDNGSISFRWTPKVGYHSYNSYFNLPNSTRSFIIDFDRKAIPTYGLQIESLFRNSGNKYGIVAAFDAFRFQNETEHLFSNTSPGPVEVIHDLSVVSFGVGPRASIYKENNSDVFLTMLVNGSVITNSEDEYEYEPWATTISPKISFRSNDKYLLELMYLSNLKYEDTESIYILNINGQYRMSLGYTF